ncbi:MAG TPA: phosphoribosyltransferase family protein [Candidatus Binatia bacterium]|jgi:predicted phosphoribosyltransferase|nr:phosphoribosyltransferase family protein [Candidatus Binatia bacterium]
MPFEDRADAAGRLAGRLMKFKGDPGAMVAALPRGGVVIGRIVADALGLPLDLVVPRKIGAQGDPEYAIGAVTEEGDAVWNEKERGKADPAYLDDELERQRTEARRRLGTYRAGLPERSFEGKKVLLVDDGAATGLTMRAALATVRRGKAALVVVALPVCPPDTAKELAADADDVIVLEEPAFFMSIGGFYEEFPQVEDDEVLMAMKGKSEKKKA